MSEPLLNVLKLCLLVLIYLFFMRVLHAVWVEVSGPRQRRRRTEQPPAKRAVRTAGRSRGLPSRLSVVEPEAERGRTFPLADELTVGRAAGCQVTLDDTYISQLHARIFFREGKFYVEDLGSTNGTYLNRAKVGGPMVMGTGDQLQVGSVVLEVT